MRKVRNVRTSADLEMKDETMNQQAHFQFVANASAQALKLLEADKIDREALRKILHNLHAFARDQAILVQPDSPRHLGNRLKQWRA